jgi:hypothetical protein
VANTVRVVWGTEADGVTDTPAEVLLAKGVKLPVPVAMFPVPDGLPLVTEPKMGMVDDPVPRGTAIELGPTALVPTEAVNVAPVGVLDSVGLEPGVKRDGVWVAGVVSIPAEVLFTTTGVVAMDGETVAPVGVWMLAEPVGLEPGIDTLGVSTTGVVSIPAEVLFTTTGVVAMDGETVAPVGVRMLAESVGLEPGKVTLGVCTTGVVVGIPAEVVILGSSDVVVTA